MRRERGRRRRTSVEGERGGSVERRRQRGGEGLERKGEGKRRGGKE
jgi:hypothetical protein